jgi:uncharacterized protein (TIGR02996 family)
VTTEDDFRRGIDANPEDWQTLLVFSDWLRERNDPRADGYAALVRLQKRPRPDTHSTIMPKKQQGDWFSWGKVGTAGRMGRRGTTTAKERDPYALPPDWYDAASEFNQLPDWDAHAWSYFHTCSSALDAAALGFTKLPAERCAKLLARPTVPKSKVARSAAPKPKKKRRTGG